MYTQPCFFYLLKDFDEPLWDSYTNHSKLSIVVQSYTNHSKLSVVVQMFTIMLDHGLSGTSYDRIIEWTISILPKKDRLKENFYAAKYMMKPLSLWYQKINMCPNFYMFYFLENTELTECRTCKHSHYKPIIGKWRTIITFRKLRYFLITFRI
jgi:hypothetical protein